METPIDMDDMGVSPILGKNQWFSCTTLATIEDGADALSGALGGSPGKCWEKVEV